MYHQPFFSTPVSFLRAWAETPGDENDDSDGDDAAAIVVLDTAAVALVQAGLPAWPAGTIMA